MERPSADEARRAGKALVLGLVLGAVLLVLGRTGVRVPAPVRRSR